LWSCGGAGRPVVRRHLWRGLRSDNYRSDTTFAVRSSARGVPVAIRALPDLCAGIVSRRLVVPPRRSSPSPWSSLLAIPYRRRLECAGPSARAAAWTSAVSRAAPGLPPFAKAPRVGRNSGQARARVRVACRQNLPTEPRARSRCRLAAPGSRRGRRRPGPT
jgi:hypothetical protein